MARIILEEKLPKKSALLTGRPYGEEARRYFDIDKKDSDNEIYNVIVNEEKIKAIAPSFLLGLFSISIKKFGEENFKKKYFFQNSKNENVNQYINKNIQEAIDWALREKNPMGE